MAQDDDEESDPREALDRPWHWAVRVAVGAGALVVIVGAATLVLLLVGRPGVSLDASTQALAQVRIHGLGELSGVHATSEGRPVDLSTGLGGLVPTDHLRQGETVRVTATVTAPPWLRWLLGSAVSTTMTVRTPATSLASAVSVTSVPGRLPVRFDHPVRIVEYESTTGAFTVIDLAKPVSVVDLAVPPGSTEGFLHVGAAPRTWESLALPRVITWFVAPGGRGPVVRAEPVPGSTDASMSEAIILTFDEPVTAVLGAERPTISPSVSGTWSEPGPETIAFMPSQAFGYGPGAEVTVRFPRPVTILGTTSRTNYHFGVRSGSLLRLEQVLAELHYLPLDFVPAAGVQSPTTFAGEVATIDDPLAGNFTWRWVSTPATLRVEWSPGLPTAMVKGALMAFDATAPDYDGYQADDEAVAQLANAVTWKVLLEDVVGDKLDPFAYSYVYVTENLPETLTLWENGKVVLTSRANTGISEEPTATGTYPIYVRYAENYMSGTNPDGSHYDDLVQWIDYFNGGDAVHGFVRGSYGFPQSLGCVELPVPTAAEAYPRLAVGDLVTVAG